MCSSDLEETVEAEVVSMSPSVHDKGRGGKEVWKGHEQPKGRMRKGVNPDNNDIGDNQGDLNCGYNNIGTVDNSDES